MGTKENGYEDRGHGGDTGDGGYVCMVPMHVNERM